MERICMHEPYRTYMTNRTYGFYSLNRLFDSP
jgi:hypothetical protein